jgi:hypothetical protein
MFVQDSYFLLSKCKFILVIILKFLGNEKEIEQELIMENNSKDGEERGVYRVLIGRPEGRRPLGRSRHRWEDNIKMDLREIGINGVNWIQLVQDRVQWWTCVNMAMNLWVL